MRYKGKKYSSDYTVEERKSYNHWYRKALTERKLESYTTKRETEVHPKQDMTQICSTFGCRNQLTLTEKLCGNTCIGCQSKPAEFHNGKL